MNSEKDVLTSLSLLERAKKGHEESWKDIQLLYTPLIYFWCRNADVKGSDAEEIWSIVLCKAFEGLSKFEHNGRLGAFRAWLHTITHRAISDMWKHANRWVVEPDETLVRIPDDHEEQASSRASEEDTILYQRAWELICSEFSERDQNIFRRYAENGESPKDIADDLEVKPSVVHMAIYRIKKRIRERFSGEFEE